MKIKKIKKKNRKEKKSSLIVLGKVISSIKCFEIAFISALNKIKDAWKPFNNGGWTKSKIKSTDGKCRFFSTLTLFLICRQDFTII